MDFVLLRFVFSGLSGLGYSEWRNFTKVINKARTSCETAGHRILDHFVEVNKTIDMPKGATKDINDLMLTRFGCPVRKNDPS